MMRHSIAWPRGTIRSCVQGASPAGDVDHRLHEIDAVDHLGHGCSTWRRVFISMK
jgi:hypothetical protein